MHDSALQGRHGGLRAVADIETAENDVDVPFDSRLADAESFADLPITAALDDQLQHFQLARAQLRMRRAFRQTLGGRGGKVPPAAKNPGGPAGPPRLGQALSNVGLAAPLRGFLRCVLTLLN